MNLLLLAASAPELASEAGTQFRDVGIAIIAILVPLAVVLLMARWVLSVARRMLVGPGGDGGVPYRGEGHYGYHRDADQDERWRAY